LLFVGYTHGYGELIDLENNKSLELIPLTTRPFKIKRISRDYYTINSGKKMLLFNSIDLKFHQIYVEGFKGVSVLNLFFQNKTSSQEIKNHSIVVSYDKNSINFQKIKLEESGEAINEQKMEWGVDPHYKLIKINVFNDLLIGVFGNQDFDKKRTLGKTAHPFHFNMESIK
jgi:hypothetical protein